ncbi:MAG TPA: BLUF domain-containing protein [Stellaceae bacterium]|nr:BLUF domain-containing protein [Stellaceae bacterium]
MLYTLVYVSCATSLSPEVLTGILRQSRVNNERLGITGLLLYVEGNFMQALEGPREAVLGLYEEIRRDPRHKDVTTIVSLPSEARSFERWSMAFRSAEELPEKELAGVSAFLDGVHHTGTIAAIDPTNFATRLLEEFAATMR